MRKVLLIYFVVLQTGYWFMSLVSLMTFTSFMSLMALMSSMCRAPLLGAPLAAVREALPKGFPEAFAEGLPEDDVAMVVQLDHGYYINQ